MLNHSGLNSLIREQAERLPRRPEEVLSSISGQPESMPLHPKPTVEYPITFRHLRLTDLSLPLRLILLASGLSPALLLLILLR